MKFWTKTIASLALVGSLAAPAFATSEKLSDSVYFMAMPDGSFVQTKVTDAHMAEMMLNGAMPMTSGTMMMMHGGKMYMVPDKKLPDGRMLSDVAMH